MKTDTSWWWSYRKRKYVNRRQLTVEMVLRKSFIETLKEYLDNTSLGGIKQIRDQNNSKFECLCWLTVFCFAISSFCVFLYGTWMTTFTNPLIVTSESFTYPIKDIDFPAVALCNFNRISRKSLSAHLKAAHKRKYHTHNFTGLKLETFYKYLGILIDYRYEESMHTILDDIEFNISLTTIMKKLAPSCEDMLIKCLWAGKEVNCTQIFDTRRTTMGHCCAFNYVLELNSIGGNSPGLIAPAKRQQVPGLSNGLVVVADPMVEDYAYRFANIDGFQILLFEPQHFPEVSAGRVLYRIAQPNEAAFFQIKSIKQYATTEVRKYPLSTRKCLFHNELKSKYRGMYSYNACLVRCRIDTILSLCKCIPYFYPIAEYKDATVCTYIHLRCLNKYKEKFLNLYPIDIKNISGLESELVNSLYCPDCLPDCELTQHFIVNYKISLAPISRTGFKTHFLVGLNLTNKCVVAIYQQTAVGTLHRLDVIAYWYEILSNFGGFAGLIMGIGSFTFAEIIYYPIIRFMRRVFVNYRHTNK